MSDFFKNNPMARRHCFLYEYLRKNSAHYTYFVFRDTVGRDVIKPNEFPIWYQLFNKFNQGVFDMNEPIADMREVLRSDKYALRACVLYESLKYKLADNGYSTERLWFKSNILFSEINSSFSMFKMFCDVIGDDVMEYREFDFWFYRFLNGDYELNFERDEDKKIHELSDMPIVVMENIVGYLDIFARINLAKTSRRLQTFVDVQKQFHHTLRLEITNYSAYVSFRMPFNIEYFRNSVGCKRRFKRRETQFRGVDHWKQALLDFKGIVKNPKLYLDTLKIESDVDDESVLNDLKGELKFAHHLNVKNFILKERSWESLAKIVPMLKPGYLTTINIDSRNPNVDSMKGVFETEQWKQAKCFFMAGDYFIWPLCHLYHFEEFTVELKELSVEDIRQMKETLFKSTNFKKCSFMIYGINDAHAIGQEFGVPIREGLDFRIYHYPIPNSTEYFKITIDDEAIEIKRKN